VKIPQHGGVAMARFKHYDYGQMKLIPVSFRQQILPGTFEYTLSYLIDHEVDLTVVVSFSKGVFLQTR